MKKIYAVMLFAVFIFLSCESKKIVGRSHPSSPPVQEILVSHEIQKLEIQPVTIPDTPKQEIVIPPAREILAVHEIPKVDKHIPSPDTVVKTPEPESIDEEYMRSISEIEKGQTVSRQDFEDDKRKILSLIDELADVMKDYDYDAWLKYIEPSSVNYWQNARNLATASRKLPVSVRSQLPNQRLRNLRDYFTFVFVPSRQGRTVDEIRYISTVDVKAVQVTNESDIIFYYFSKIDGKWFVHLPSN